MPVNTATGAGLSNHPAIGNLREEQLMCPGSPMTARRLALDPGCQASWAWAIDASAAPLVDVTQAACGIDEIVGPAGLQAAGPPGKNRDSSPRMHFDRQCCEPRRGLPQPGVRRVPPHIIGPPGSGVAASPTHRHVAPPAQPIGQGRKPHSPGSPGR